MKRRVSPSQPSERLRSYGSSNTAVLSTWRRSSLTSRMPSTLKRIKVRGVSFHKMFRLDKVCSSSLHSGDSCAYVESPSLCFQGHFTWCLSTWTTTSWACWSRAWFSSPMSTFAVSCASWWRVWITATRTTSCTETSSAPISCSTTG